MTRRRRQLASTTHPPKGDPVVDASCRRSKRPRLSGRADDAMARAPSAFRDVTRAVKAVVAVGVPRRGLRNRCDQKLVEVKHGGILYTAGAGRFEDGRLAEIFLTTAKHGRTVDVSARDGAGAASMLLRHPCPLDTLRRALTRNSDAAASGPLVHALDLLAEGT
jgi:ribonucleoside-diphosphate reductase alpha chain